MLLLSVDSSAVTASAALTDGEAVIKSELINKGLTHSETLLPLIEGVMQGYEYSSLDAIAVSAGPGSFTGIRIGIATVKGIAFPFDIPCIPVSTLEAIAYNFVDENAIVCAVMDARRMQFYNSLFKIENSRVVRITEDKARPLEEIEAIVKQYPKVIVAGDGAELFCKSSSLDNIIIADEEKRFQCGIGVSKCAQNKEKINPSSLMPVYLRQSQAERELKLKK